MESDPVAAKSSWLCTYMSHHQDTLVIYASQHLKRKDVTGASMMQIDSKCMLLKYSLNGAEQKDPVRIPFDPPLLGYEEVKPRLLAMKIDAEVELGVAKNPTIREFLIPWKLILLGPGIPELAIFFITFSSSSYAEVARAYVPPMLMKISWAILITVHPLEAIYALILCIRHNTGLYYGMLWTLLTLLVGYPGWAQFKKLVQHARIESILKGQ